MRSLIYALAAKGAKNVVLTGVSFEEGKTGVMTYNSASGEFSYYCHEKLPVSYHGTGDIFSSAFVGALMNGNTPGEAVAVAADFTAECIRVTLGNSKEKWYGVDFEQCVPYLVKRLGK